MLLRRIGRSQSVASRLKELVVSGIEEKQEDVQERRLYLVPIITTIGTSVLTLVGCPEACVLTIPVGLAMWGVVAVRGKVQHAKLEHQKQRFMSLTNDTNEPSRIAEIARATVPVDISQMVNEEIFINAQ